MMNNNFGNFQQNGMGMGYAQNNQQSVVMNQTLTKEEIDLLRKKGPKFNFKLTKEEFLRAICTHKDPQSGNISLRLNQDGTHTCAICSETFTLLEPSRFDRAAIEDICANFNDLFQSIKTMYGPIPAESGRELYTMIGFIPKIPELYEIASEYFARLNGAGVGVEENRNPYGMNMLHAMMNTGFPMGNTNMNMNQAVNPACDPNYMAYLQHQQQMANAGGTNVSTFNPGTPNPNYAPNNNNNPGFNNPIGYVETEQTVQTGPQGNIAPNVGTAFKG
jgi:hypothetical protein